MKRHKCRAPKLGRCREKQKHHGLVPRRHKKTPERILVPACRSIPLTPICHLLSPICHLPSPICHLPSAISHLPSTIYHLPSTICHFPFKWPCGSPRRSSR